MPLPVCSASVEAGNVTAGDLSAAFPMAPTIQAKVRRACKRAGPCSLPLLGGLHLQHVCMRHMARHIVLCSDCPQLSQPLPAIPSGTTPRTLLAPQFLDAATLLEVLEHAASGYVGSGKPSEPWFAQVRDRRLFNVLPAAAPTVRQCQTSWVPEGRASMPLL